MKPLHLAIVAACVALAGIVLGPVYWGYALFGSGSLVKRTALTSQRSSVSVDLSPEMNPIRVIAKLHRRSRAADLIRGELVLGDETVWAVDFGVSRAGRDSSPNPAPVGPRGRPVTNQAGEGGGFARPLPMLDVDRAGTYRLRITRPEGLDTFSGTMAFHVRRNAWSVNTAVVIVGGVLLLAGLAGLGLAGWKARGARA